MSSTCCRQGARARELWPAACALAIAVSCGAGLPHPLAEDVTIASRNPRRTTLAELQLGRDLVIQHCAGCHTLKLPGELAPPAWRTVVAEMQEERGVKLTAGEARAIVAYLEAIAARPQ